MRRRSIRTAVLAPLLAAGLLLPATPLRAAFFMRLRDTAGSRQLRMLGGRTIYRSGARVNGEDTSLEVMGFDFPPEEVADELRRLWNLPLAAPAAGDGAIRIVSDLDGRRRRHLLLLPGNDGRCCTAWLIGPLRHAGGVVPPPPEPFPHPAAQPRFWAAIERSRSLLVVAETAEAPEAALRGAAAGLAAEGWTPAPPAGDGRPMAVFARGGRACVAFAARDATRGVTRLTVLRQGSAAR